MSVVVLVLLMLLAVAVLSLVQDMEEREHKQELGMDNHTMAAN